MKRLLLGAIVLLLGAQAFPQSQVTYGTPASSRRPSRGGGGGTTPPVPSFPAGLIHLWKMEEATGATRNDSIGSIQMVEGGTGDVSQVAGKNGFAAESIGGVNGPFLNAGTFDVSGSFSFAVWVREPIGVVAAIGPTGEDLLLTVDEAGTVNLYLWDPATGDSSKIPASDAGTPGPWVLLIARFDQLAKTFNLRTYGFGGGAGNFQGAPDSGPWVYDFAALTVRPLNFSASEATAGAVDELMMFDRVLTDDQCDALWNGGAGLFYTP